MKRLRVFLKLFPGNPSITSAMEREGEGGQRQADAGDSRRKLGKAAL